MGDGVDYEFRGAGSLETYKGSAYVRLISLSSFLPSFPSPILHKSTPTPQTFKTLTSNPLSSSLPRPSEMQSTRILKVTIASGSAKIREGVPEDSAADMQNTDNIWTGVLPLYEQYGEPVPGPYNKVEEVPEHVKGYGEETSRGNREYAVEAARKGAPVKIKQRNEDEE